MAKQAEQVTRFQELCRSVLNDRVTVGSNRYWGKRAYVKDSYYGWNWVPAAISLLQRRGFLRVTTVGRRSPIGNQLPLDWFGNTGGIGAYEVISDREDELKTFTTDRKKAAAILGIVLATPKSRLSLDQAIARIKEEIQDHPDPSKRLMQILQRVIHAYQ